MSLLLMCWKASLTSAGSRPIMGYIPVRARASASAFISSSVRARGGSCAAKASAAVIVVNTKRTARTAKKAANFDTLVSPFGLCSTSQTIYLKNSASDLLLHRGGCVLMFQVLVQVGHRGLERLLLHRIRLVRAVGLAVAEDVSVDGMVEAHPGHVLARLLHPFIGQLENSLQVVLVPSHDQDGRVDGLNSRHGLGLISVSPDYFNILILTFCSFARRVGPGIHAQEFVGRRFDTYPGVEVIFTGRLQDHLPAMAHPHSPKAVLVHVGQGLQVAQDRDQVFVVERRIRLQRAPAAADAVGEILAGTILVLIKVRHLVAIVDSRHYVAARNHAVLHWRQPLGEFLHLQHAALAFT